MTLYEISNEYLSSLNNAMTGDEINEEQLLSIRFLEGNLDDKIVAVAAYIKNLESESESIKSAMKEMKLRSERLDNKASFLTGYLKSHMEICGIKEVRKSPHFVIKVKQNPISVRIDNEEMIDSYFKKIKVTSCIDKLKIKEALDRGVEVIGAHLEQKTRLEIK